ncbi:hypothetical protein G6F31_020279 [Rhizopus arrhizus]|nr:hypothetical protein G6F31_020279 [Rhizopus arrhizus]
MAGPAQREAAQRRAAGEFFGGQAQRVFGVAAVAGDVAVRDQDGFAILQMGAQQPQQGVLAATRGAHQTLMPGTAMACPRNGSAKAAMPRCACSSASPASLPVRVMWNV